MTRILLRIKGQSRRALKPLDAHSPSSTLQKQIQDGSNEGTKKERWYALWDILFPATPAPPTPCKALPYEVLRILILAADYDDRGSGSQTSKLAHDSQSEWESDSSGMSQGA